MSLYFSLPLVLWPLAGFRFLSISGRVELVGRGHLQARPITPLLLAWRGMDFLACVGM